jgi:hypothetical protein
MTVKCHLYGVRMAILWLLYDSNMTTKRRPVASAAVFSLLFEY